MQQCFIITLVKLLLPRYRIQKFFAEFHGSQILRICNTYKLSDFAITIILLVAFKAVFRRHSFCRWKTKSIPFEKDTFYRILKFCATHWHKFMRLLCTAINRKVIAPLTSAECRNILNIDDSLFSHNHSKKVALLAYVYART